MHSKCSAVLSFLFLSSKLTTSAQNTAAPPSHQPLMNKEAKKGECVAHKPIWVWNDYSLKSERRRGNGRRYKKEHKPSEKLFENSWWKTIFFRGINLPCVWVCVQTFCVWVKSRADTQREQDDLWLLEATTDSFQHRSSIVTDSHPCLPGFTSRLCSPSQLLLSPETCHHPLCSSGPPACPGGPATKSIPS